MSNLNENDKVREHLANERTFLAWIRTSIAMMGFGFVIVKFAVFVQEAAIILGEKTPLVPKANSAKIGIGMVALGAVIAALAYVGFANTRKVINAGTYQSKSGLNLLMTILIILTSIMLIVFLLPGK